MRSKDNFFGYRLREAREVRSFTVAQLAERVGVSKQAISQYESGKTAPTPENLFQISRVLDIPAQFFQRPKEVLEAAKTPLQFRSFKSATKADRMAAANKAEWLAEATDYLSTFVDLPINSLPDLAIGEDFLNLTAPEIEEIAIETRRAWNIGSGPISNLARLLESRGIIIARLAIAEKLDAFSFYRNKKPFIVLGRENTTFFRSRFDAAHELAHLILHANVDQEDLWDNEKLKIIEKNHAHRFASAFLMPGESFKSEAKSLSMPFLLELKKRWGVSVQAIVFRMHNLNIITDETKTNFFRNYRNRKFEPLDQDYPLEKPYLLTKVFEMLITEGLITPQDFTFKLGLNKTHAAEILGVDQKIFERTENGKLIDFDITLRKPLP